MAGRHNPDHYREWVIEQLTEQKTRQGGRGIPSAGGQGSRGMPPAISATEIQEAMRTRYTPLDYNRAHGSSMVAVRAVQGHGIREIDYTRMYTRVSVDMLRWIEVLWHGTRYTNVLSIMKTDLQPMERNMVHCVAFPFGHPQSRKDAFRKYDVAIELGKCETMLTNRMWLTPTLTIMVEGNVPWQCVTAIWGFEGSAATTQNLGRRTCEVPAHRVLGPGKHRPPDEGPRC
jgi:hypothetical protein